MRKNFIITSLAMALASQSLAQNPIISGQFTADPTARVFNGKIYLYPSHDIPSPIEKLRTWFCMPDYHVFSSSNLTDWQDHGVIVSQDRVPWVQDGSYTMWAPDCVCKDGKYYLTFPWVREKNGTETLAYAMADHPMGPFTFKGIIMDESPTGCWTNHHSIVEYQNQWYLFYHHNDYSPKFDKNRSTRIDSLSFNADGTIRKVIPTLRGVGVTTARSRIQIDRYSALQGKGVDVAYLDTTNYFKGWKTVFAQPQGALIYNNVDFGKEKVEQITVRAKSSKGGTLIVKADGANGKVIAKVKVPKSNAWRDVRAKVLDAPLGSHAIYVTLQQGRDVVVDWLGFDALPWEKGAFETHEYRNLFTELGYKQSDVDKKLKEVFDGVFFGKNKVYFEVGDSMGYISDVKNHDVRTEGMSYGLMLAVQFDRKDIFDRIWRWGKKYMQNQDGPWKGYFAWSCKTDGTRNSNGPASWGMPSAMTPGECR